MTVGLPESEVSLGSFYIFPPPQYEGWREIYKLILMQPFVQRMMGAFFEFVEVLIVIAY